MSAFRSIQVSARSVSFGVVAVVAAISIECTSAGATTCSTVAACVFGINTRSTAGSGFGADAGIEATSLNGDGLDASTAFVSSSSSAARSGVAGFDESASGAFNSGVFGFSGKGSGVHGTSNNGTGVLAIATSSHGVALHAIGFSRALQANFQDGTGLTVQDAANLTYEANTGIAVNDLGDGIDVGTDFGTALTVTGGPMGSGTLITANGGDALDIDQNGPGIPLFITPGGASEDEILVSGLFALDPSGNLTISGSLTQNGTPMAMARTAAGNLLRTYAPREAEATIEDVGEAMVSGGGASIALDPAFASTVDFRRPYYVFLTAEGDNRGLYVTAKSAHGFVIRESNGGRSTLGVQYRIVAKPLDAGQSPRLAVVDSTRLPYALALTRNHIAHIARQEARSKRLFAQLRAAR
jgi:hypothetical protein